MSGGRGGYYKKMMILILIPSIDRNQKKNSLSFIIQLYKNANNYKKCNISHFCYVVCGKR